MGEKDVLRGIADITIGDERPADRQRTKKYMDDLVSLNWPSTKTLTLNSSTATNCR